MCLSLGRAPTVRRCAYRADGARAGIGARQAVYAVRGGERGGYAKKFPIKETEEMNCGFCGEENSDGARFCKKCGRRIDGKKACPKCGVLTDENSVYCENCGARLDGKKVCEKCGTAFDGNFCPSCGAGATAPKRSAGARQKAAPAPDGNESALSRILGWVSGGLAMAAVLFALIFVFLLGVTFVTKEVGTPAVKSPEIKHTFAYFTQAFDVFKSVKNGFSDIYEGYRGLVCGPAVVLAVFQMIVAAATLITVITFSIVAIMRFVKKAIGSKSKDCFPAALGAVISLAAGAGALLLFNYGKETGLDGYDVIRSSGATIAGIALSASCIGIAAILKLVACGKKVLAPKNLLKAFLSLATAATAIVTMALVARMALKIENESFDATTKTYESAAYLFADIMALAGRVSISDAGSSIYYKDSLTYDRIKSLLTGSIVTGTLSIILTFAALVLIGYTLYRAVKSFSGEKAGCSTVVIAIVGFVVALAAMILLIISGNLAVQGADEFSTITTVAESSTAIGGMAIVAVIFAFITAGLAVASFIVSRRDDEDDSAETNAQAEI